MYASNLIDPEFPFYSLFLLQRFLTLRVRPQVPHRTLERLESTPLLYAGQRNRKPSADRFSELSPIPMEKNSPYVPPSKCPFLSNVESIYFLMRMSES